MGKVFVGGLARETTTEGLRGYFERFGDISDCVVMKDRATGLPRGFGFVTYASQLVADRVVHHRHVVDGKEVEAKPAVPRDSEMLARNTAPPMGMPGLPGMMAPNGLPGFPGVPNQPIAGVPGHPLQLGAQYGGQAAGQNAAESSRKIFVGGLSHETSEADFNAYFGARRRMLRHPHRPPAAAARDAATPHSRRARARGLLMHRGSPPPFHGLATWHMPSRSRLCCGGRERQGGACPPSRTSPSSLPPRRLPPPIHTRHSSSFCSPSDWRLAFP